MRKMKFLQRKKSVLFPLALAGRKMKVHKKSECKIIKTGFPNCKFLFTILVFLSIFYYQFSHAQTAPGGIGNAGGSDGQPLLKLWLLPDSLSLSDGDDVSSWTDYSGNSHDLSQSNSSYTPVFRTNDAAINNHDYLEFSKSNNRIIRNPFTMPADALAVFIVIKTTDSGEGVVSYAVSGESNEYLLFDSGSLKTYIGGNNSNSSVSYNDDSWKIFSHQWRKSDGRLLFHIDGTEEENTTHRNGYAVTASGGLAIGGEQDTVDGGYVSGQAFQGDIAEIIMYGSSLKQAERTIIENYLGQKYNLDGNLPADLYVPGDADYIKALTGIGKESDGETNPADCEGLYVTENGGLDNGEYLLAAHDGTINIEDSINTSSEVTNAGVDSAWNRSWYIDVTGTFNAKIAFDFGEGIDGKNPGELQYYELLYRPDLTSDYSTVTVAGKGVQNGDQIYFTVNSGNLSDGYYTLGSTDAANSPLTGVESQTWYTLISGDWENWETWTLDPSGALPDNPDNSIPASIDDAVILSGKTVTINQDSIAAAALTVQGRLDFQDYTGHSFASIRGGGKILLAADNFPSGADASHFYTDGQGEGTVEYYGTSYDLDQALEFYNLEIDLNNASGKLTLLKDYTVNGSLDIKTGALQINDNTSTTNLNMTVSGDMTVFSNGSVLTGTADARHQLNLYGNFVNNGIVKFTNRTSPGYGSEAANGIVDANFLSDNANQQINCNDTTVFYRIEIDKGNSFTYQLQIEASDSNYFNLYGYAGETHGSTDQLTENNNALGLIRGTVNLKENVDVLVLNNSGNYNISEAAQLWIDGGSAAKNSGTAIVPYGQIRVSDGTLEAKIGSGITIRKNGLVKNDGGIIRINQLRTSVYGAGHVGGYVQSGGTTHVLGASTNTDYYCFNLTYGGNVFNMSGGTLHIHEAHGRGGIFIGSDLVNYNVSGGTVIMEIDDNNDFEITSTAPFYNVIIRNTSGGSGEHLLTNGEDVGATDEDLAAQPLVVLNDLTIEDDAFLNHEGNDVTVGRNFSISENAQQQSGGANNYGYLFDASYPNTTTFNGTDNGVFYIGHPDSEVEEWELYINRMVVNKPSGKQLLITSDSEKEAANVSGAWKCRILKIDSIFVQSGIVNQGDHALRFTGNVINYDQLTV